MRPDVTAPISARHAALSPDVSTARSGPVTVGVGQAVDGTLRAGALVAHRLGRGIAVISVIEPLAVYLWNPPSVPIPPDYEEERSHARWTFLEDQMRTAATGGASWSVDVFWGGVPRTVARAAHDLRSPCIVMGLGRHRPVDRLLGGETAVRTVRHADCPVLAVPAAFGALPRTIVAGTDFSDASAHAIRTAMPLFGPDATLHLVHAWQPIAQADPSAASYDADYRAQLPNRFARFVAAVGVPGGTTVRTELMEGRPADRLIAFADERAAELIVVGRHGRGMMERLLVGSVTTRVLRGATCAVFVVPEPVPSVRVELAERRGGATRSIPRDEWTSVLDGFTRRFAGRLVTLDVSDPAGGLHTEERGSVLFGASFDAAERRLEIILGEPHGRRRHLTRVVPNPTVVAMLLTPTGDDDGIHVLHGTGETLLRIQPLASQPTS